MSDKAPLGGTRRLRFENRVAGVLATPYEVAVDVYLDGTVTPDAGLSAAATAGLDEVATGIFLASYSISALAAGTFILEVIKLRQLIGDTLVAAQSADAIVESVLAVQAGVASDKVTLQLLRAGCC